MKKKIDVDSGERIAHWRDEIVKGAETIKVLLVGAGHVWNDKKKPTDIMHRLAGAQWVVTREVAYVPPGHTSIDPLNINNAALTNATYKLVKYPQRKK